MRDPSASEAVILVGAGYSPTTARTPLSNNLNTTELAARVAREDGVSVKEAAAIGLKVLVELAEDESQAGGTRGGASRTLIEHHLAHPESSDENITRLAIHAQTVILKAILLGARLTTRYGNQAVGRRFLPAYLGNLKTLQHLEHGDGKADAEIALWAARNLERTESLLNSTVIIETDAIDAVELPEEAIDAEPLGDSTDG